MNVEMNITPKIVASLILMFSLVNSVVFAQERFVKVYGGNSFDEARGVVQTLDEGYVIAGSTGSFDLSHGHFMLIRTDAWGSVQWRKYYGTQFSSSLRSMASASDGGFIMAGITESLESSYQILAIRTDVNGETLWARQFGGENWDIANKVIALADGGFAIAGQTFSYGAGQGDAYLIRLDDSGDTLWTATFGGNAVDAAMSVAETADGGFILCGQTQSSGEGQGDIWMIRVDFSGDLIWEKTYGGEEMDVANAVVQTMDGGFAVAGSTRSSSVGEADFYLFKVNEDGQQQWVDKFGGPLNDEWLGLMEESDGDLVTIGYSQTTEIGGGGEDIFIKRVSSDGWFANLQTTYGLGGDERGYQAIRTADNGYAIVGTTDGYLNRMDDVLLIKADASGQSTVNSVLTGIDGAAHFSDMNMLQVAPNPFSGHTELTVKGVAFRPSEEMIIEIFCPLGKVIQRSSIRHETTPIDLSGHGAGVFSFRLRAGQYVLARGTMLQLP